MAQILSDIGEPVPPPQISPTRAARVERPARRGRTHKRRPGPPVTRVPLRHDWTLQDGPVLWIKHGLFGGAKFTFCMQQRHGSATLGISGV